MEEVAWNASWIRPYTCMCVHLTTTSCKVFSYLFLIAVITIRMEIHGNTWKCNTSWNMLKQVLLSHIAIICHCCHFEVWRGVGALGSRFATWPSRHARMGSHSWGYALAKLDAPRKPEDLLGVSPEPDLWDDEEDDVDAFNYYWDFYGLGFPEMDSIHSTTKVKFPTNGRIKRFLKQSRAKEMVEEFLRRHGFSSDAMDMQSWSHTFLPFERLGPLHMAAKEGETDASCRWSQVFLFGMSGIF